MASTIKVNTITTESGSTITIGESGKTISIPSGATLSTSGTNTFASLGVTGDLTVDTNTLYVDSTNNRVGIGTASPDKSLHIYNGASGATPYGTGIVIEDDTHTYLEFVTPTGLLPGITWGTPTQQTSGAILYHTTDKYIRFNTDASEKMRIDSSGDVGIGTTSPSQKLDVVGSIEVSDGIYVGGTAAANKLDDYEEGTWLPTFQGTTGSPSGVNFTTRAGFYRKIGTTVFISVNLNVSSWSSGPTGNLRIGTLPFSTSSASDYNAAFNIGYAANFATNTTPFSGQIPASANQIRLYKKNGSDARSALTTNSATADVSGDEHIILSGFYETD